MVLLILTCAVSFTSKTATWNEGTTAPFQRYAHLTQFPDKSSGTLQFSYAGWAPVPRHTSPDNIILLSNQHGEVMYEAVDDDRVVNFCGACFVGKFDVLVV